MIGLGSEGCIAMRLSLGCALASAAPHIVCASFNIQPSIAPSLPI